MSSSVARVDVPTFNRKDLFTLHVDYEYMSNEKNPGCLGYKGDYTTQLYRGYNKPL